MRLYGQGELAKDDLYVNVPFGTKARKLPKPDDIKPAKRASTEPGPNWGTYEEPDWYTVTNSMPDEYSVDGEGTEEAVNT